MVLSENDKVEKLGGMIVFEESKVLKDKVIDKVTPSSGTGYIGRDIARMIKEGKAEARLIVVEINKKKDKK